MGKQSTHFKPKLQAREEFEKTVFDTGCQIWVSEFCFTDNIHFAHFFRGLQKVSPEGYKSFIFQEKDLVWEAREEVIPFDNGKFLTFGSNYFLDKLFIKHFTNIYRGKLKYYWLKSFMRETAETKVGITSENKLIGVLLLNKLTKGN